MREMNEIFEYKKELTEKINYNTRLLSQIEAAEDPNLKEKAIRGRKILSIQVGERQKLTYKKIAELFQITEATVRYKYNVFTGGKF